MVLIEGKLVIYGGLEAQPNRNMVSRGCSSDAVTVVSLEGAATDKTGRSSVTFTGALLVHYLCSM